MSVSAGPARCRRTRRSKLAREWQLLRRDGPIKYVRVLHRLRRFHRAVDRMDRI